MTIIPKWVKGEDPNQCNHVNYAMPSKDPQGSTALRCELDWVLS